jgi:hypothetical protein
MIAGGIGTAVAIVAALAYLGDDRGGPANSGPSQSMAVPSSGPAQSQARPSGASASTPGLNGLSAGVRAAVEAAQQAADAGIEQMNMAGTAIQQGTQAATDAQNGQGGYQVTTLPTGAVAAGDIATIASGGIGMVSIVSPQGMLFTGAYQEGPSGSSMQGGATWGAASASGFWSYSGSNYQFTGVASITGRVQWAGQESGALSASTGQGVLTYPDGSRYFGGYRTAGEGPQAQVFRHGLGAFYNARGDLIEAGEFESDRLVSAQ